MRFVRTFSVLPCHRTRSGFTELNPISSDNGHWRYGGMNTAQNCVALMRKVHSNSISTALTFGLAENPRAFESKEVLGIKHLRSQESDNTQRGDKTHPQEHEQITDADAIHPLYYKHNTLSLDKNISLYSSGLHRNHFIKGCLNSKLSVRNFATGSRAVGSLISHKAQIAEDVTPKDKSSHQRSSSSKRETNHRLDIRKIMATDDEWISAGQHRIHAWSVSGLESCIVTQMEGIDIAFDMGYATRPSIKCAHVFISHGHIDHVAAILKHASHRSLLSLKPATYYVPPHLVEPLRKLGDSYSELHGGDENFCDLNIKPVSPGETLQVSKSISVKAFPTVHRVPSQGYIVYRTRKTLKPEYIGLPGPEIGKLVKGGIEVHEHHTLPELAYTGDTTFDVFLNPPTEDLLKVSTLITEATYIDDEKDKLGRGGVERAAARGHCHLQQFVDNESLFEQVKNLVLVHFSDKYSVRYIRKKTEELLTEQLKTKVSLGITMKQILG